MSDAKARQLWQEKNVTELFRYLNPMWLKVCIECLDDLMQVNFYPNPGQYQTELRAAGIFVERMEVAMAVVLHKRGRSIPWQKFEEIYAEKLAKLPLQQRREVREYWFAGPIPGLAVENKPVMLGAPGDWFVTGFSGDTLSIVVGAGFTVINGTITFENANGTKCNRPFGIYGPSVGLSYTPNVGKIVSKLPGATKLMAKFPILSKIITGSEEKFAERVLLYLWAESPKLRAAITAYPAVSTILKKLLENRNSVSGAAESWWSAAIGLVSPRGLQTLTESDFPGQCVCYAVTGAVGPGNFGTYVLFFGIDKDWNPISEPTSLVDLTKLEAKSKGIAVISSASVAAGFPSLGAGVTVFWGEIK